MNDPALYRFLISHSYMLLSQSNNPITKTGSEALQYSLPNNYYLLSLLLTLRDSTSALVDVSTNTDNLYLNYNGTARVDRRKIADRLANMSLDFEGFPLPLGQVMWNGANVEPVLNGSISAKWLNMYLSNNPLLVSDIAAGFSTSGTFSVLREQIVPANVQVV